MISQRIDTPDNKPAVARTGIGAEPDFVPQPPSGALQSSSRPESIENTGDSFTQGRGNALTFLVAGVHFGVLQTALFFTAQVYITATFLGYFVVVMAWMAGTIISMRFGRPREMSTALTISMGSYFGLLLLSSSLVPSGWLYPLYFLLMTAAALPVGIFFRSFAGSSSTRYLFFHENNGFVLGLFLGLVGFTFWGVNFLAAAPLLSWCGVLIVLANARTTLLVYLPGVAYLCYRMGNHLAAGVLAVIGGLALTAWGAQLISKTQFIGRRRQTGLQTEPELAKTRPAAPAFPRLLLCLTGANLMLLQYAITREFSSILAASELAILVVAIAYFAGFSVGYLVSHAVSPAALRWGAAGMFLLHLVIFVFVKTLAGLMIDAGYGMAALVGLLFMASFCASSVYSILLPRVIDALDLPLVTAYAWDLAGAIAGTVFMLFLLPFAPQILWPVYFVAFLIIVLFLHWHNRSRYTVGVLGVAVIVALSLYQAPIQRYATEDYYRTRGYDNPELVFAGNSFYHAIEVVKTFEDLEQTIPQSRVSFINGVRYFRHYDEKARTKKGEAPLSEFVYFLAELPARYQYQRLGRPLRILILGGGSLSTINRVAPYASKTTLVEIDPLVVESSKKYWADINQWQDAKNAEIVVGDARQYLRTTDESFDLIINDVSAPYYLGTAIMHSRETYELVRARLAPGGLFSESTQSRPIPTRPNSQAMKILSGVADVFPHWRVVDCNKSPRGKRGYVYSTVNGNLTTTGLTDIMKKDDVYAGTSTYWEGTSRFKLYRAQPFSLTSMETLLTSNVGRITRRLRIGKDRKALERPSLGSVLSSSIDTSNPDHSRLLVASVDTLSRPAVVFLSAATILLAIALPWVSRAWPTKSGREAVSAADVS